MVTLVAGAVAVGIVSVCAIPLGCFISRKMKKKKVLTVEIMEDEGREPNPDLVQNSVELVDETEYQVEEISGRPYNGRAPRFEIRVLVSNGAARSADIPRSQGYITASGTSQESSSSQSGVSAQAIEARRLSLHHLATGPAAERQNQAKSTSLPIAARIGESAGDQGLQDSETTRFEITIFGPFSRSATQFGEFKNDVPESSTPRAKSSPSGKGKNRENDVPRSRFWRRASFNLNGPPKIFRTTRDIEVVNLEITPSDESHQTSNFEAQLAADENEVKNFRNRKSRLRKAAGSLDEKGPNCDNGRWGLPGRFFETFRETTNFATL